jgi:hypothetical protein
MARMMSKAKTSRVNRDSKPVPAADNSAYIRDLDRWPRSWMGLGKDLPPGEQLLTEMKPFIEDLGSSNLSPKTIRRHVDNLWLLGGEIIRDLHEDPPLRKLSAERLLRKAVYEDGGPLIHNGSEAEQRSFDSTCRKLHRFLSQSRP